ncbi:MAG: DUF5702 domain-containing protein [Roseburia sp.]
MKKGSITVFSAMSMMLIASLLFALLESARYYGLQVQTKQKSAVVTESVFAEYNAKIWEDYHLLFLDGAYGGEEFSLEKVKGAAYQLANDNLNYDLTYFGKRRTNLYQMQVSGVEVDSYQLATDGEGTVFYKYVIQVMKENLPQEAAKIVYDRIQEGEKIEEENSDVESAMQNAKLTSESESVSVRKLASESESVSMRKVAQNEEEISLLEYVSKLKQNAILGMVLSDVSQISDAAISLEDTLLKRNCEEGTYIEQEDANWYDKILFETYLTSYFSNYTKQLDNRALGYELEYLICGKKTDRANLEGVVERLMLAREAGNVASILLDSTKVNEALALATLLVGATANPEIIKGVQICIIGAWAYLESILDIRSLLQGGKVAFIKTKSQWTTDAENIISSFNKSAKAKECEDGLTYQDYLMQFLFFQGKKELSYRAMDIIEQNLHMEPAYEHVKMDHMIVSAQLSYQYGAQPLFWKLIMLEGTKDFSYSFSDTRQFSYQIE